MHWKHNRPKQEPLSMTVTNEFAIETERLLCQKLGIKQLKEAQRSVISCLLSGTSCLLISQTGSGKSVCYQFPAVYLPGFAIVISPLVALMKNQVDQLQEMGIGAESITHETEIADRARIFCSMTSGETKLLYISPERFVDQAFLKNINPDLISFIAIDEAHCLTSWGQSFRPEYMKIGLAAKELNKAIIALTATADQLTRAQIGNLLNIDAKNHFVANFDNTNVSHQIHSKINPVAQILNLFKTKRGATIIYCTTRKGVEELGDHLNASKPGLATIYHAGLPQKIRDQNQNEFLSDEKLVMVATVAFGLGINKPNIRLVVNYNTPSNLENYCQFTGRAGRDGLKAEAITFFGNIDIRTTQSLIRRESKNCDLNIWKFDQLITFYKSVYCRQLLMTQSIGAGQANLRCNICDNCIEKIAAYEETMLAMEICEWLKRKAVATLIEIQNFASEICPSSQRRNFSRSQLEIDFIIRQLALLNCIYIYEQSPILFATNPNFESILMHQIKKFLIPKQINLRPATHSLKI